MTTSTFIVNMTGIQTTLDITSLAIGPAKLLFDMNPCIPGTYLISIIDNINNACLFNLGLQVSSNNIYMFSQSYGQNNLVGNLPTNIYVYSYLQNIIFDNQNNAIYVYCDNGTIHNITFKAVIIN